MLSPNPLKCAAPDVVTHPVLLVGTGASAPTISAPSKTGITATRTGVGAYVLTFDENPGNFLGATEGKMAATPGDIAAHDWTVDTYNTSTYALPIHFYTDAGVAHELQANEYVFLVLWFKRSADEV